MEGYKYKEAGRQAGRQAGRGCKYKEAGRQTDRQMVIWTTDRQIYKKSVRQTRVTIESLADR